ncbi:hypothetical protein ACJJTC_013311 [Scirpophaga incertulas]
MADIHADFIIGSDKKSVIWMMLGIIFLAPKTTFRCIQGMENRSDYLNATCYHDCLKYEYFSEFDSSIISEWDLICDRAWLVNLVQMIFMFGVLVGSIIFGFIADRYGRRPALIIASILQLCLSLILPFSSNYWTFIALRFVLGTSSAGLMVIAFVIGIEITGPSKRDIVSSLYHIPQAVGEMIMPLFAYFLRSWKLFSIGVAIPNLVFVIYLILLPESAKWLISVGRLEEAAKVMRQAAKFNKLPTHNMMEVAQSIENEYTMSDNSVKHTKVSYLDLITKPSLRLKNLCSCLAWFILGISYYGGNQYIGQTSSNTFLVILLAGALQVPGLIISGYFYKIFGRKPTLIGFSVMCSVCNGLLAVPDSWLYLKMISGTLAITAATGAFNTMYVYTSELFPTVARNMAMGASSTAARVGSMIAPFIAGLHQAAWLPPLMFAIIPLIAAAVSFCLPETKGQKLKDRLDEK